jgi:hypothetical protein
MVVLAPDGRSKERTGMHRMSNGRKSIVRLTCTKAHSCSSINHNLDLTQAVIGQPTLRLAFEDRHQIDSTNKTGAMMTRLFISIILQLSPRRIEESKIREPTKDSSSSNKEVLEAGVVPRPAISKAGATIPPDNSIRDKAWRKILANGVVAPNSRAVRS